MYKSSKHPKIVQKVTKNDIITFGQYNWRVLDVKDGGALISEDRPAITGALLRASAMRVMSMSAATASTAGRETAAVFVPHCG
jgi:hypothetical protein